ncbi:MAG: diguanylate cyclase [Burkholderiaceae bacterium]|nr:diguanylate cyclase [Burkholderiaceae bacterium]
MDAFVWDQNFVTGLPDVDKQHHDLVDLFNELSRSMFLADTGREDLLHGTFERLVAYTEYHFRDEEGLMRAEGVDPRHIAAHESMHQEFVVQVGAMWGRRSSMSDPAEIFIGFLTSWLGLHILGIDQSLSRQITLIRAGMPAAQAFEQETSGHDNGTQALLKMIGKLYHVLSSQNAELAQANLLLEDRVAQRTQELACANDELQAANTRLEAFSRTDGLLQIANRGYFNDRLQQASAQAVRQQKPMALLMIDVDFFKRYNDSYGHQAGDACLQAVARAVQQAVHRSTDLVARYGGEELAVILPDTDTATAAAIAVRVVAAVAALGLEHKASDAAPHVSISVGVTSQVPTDDDAATTLLARADKALYRAKHTGRNRWMMA